MEGINISHTTYSVGQTVFKTSIHVVLLAFFWIVSLVLGIRYSSEHRELVTSLMHTIISSHVSIVVLVSVNFLPLLLSVVCVWIRFPHLIYVLSALDGFMIGYAANSVLLTYGSAGWLIRHFLFCSDGALLILLFWFWIRHISGTRLFLMKDCILCTCCVAAVSFADYFFISPFLQALI